MRLLLIRHALSSGQEPDADLTAEGHKQAQLLAAQLHDLGIREVFSSPYRRALATVAPFACRAGIAVQTVDDLSERKLAEGWLPDFLVHMERSFADENYRLDGGESLAMTAERGMRGLAEVARLAQTGMPAIASHGNLIASILRTVSPDFGFHAWKGMRNPDLFAVEWSWNRAISYQSLDVNR